MRDYSGMTDQEIIDEHAVQWAAWLEARRRFGEMGVSRGHTPIEIEEEARRRGIPDAVLMAPIKNKRKDYR